MSILISEKMKKLFYYLGFVSMTLAMACCRPEVNDPRNFPTVDSFSPGIAKTGDTVTIIGTYLEGSKILLSGKEIEPVANFERYISFVVSDEMTTTHSSFTLGVKFKDGSEDSFSTPILLNHVVTGPDKLTWLMNNSAVVGDTLRGPKQLLITDFDGHGIRTADATSRFDQTQWENVIKVGGTQVIGSGFRNVISSPAKGNYLYTQLNAEFVEAGSNGFVAELFTRTEVQNDRESIWPSNFSTYPSSPITLPTNTTSLNNIYLNFFMFKNNAEKGILDAYLYNDDLVDNGPYRYRVEPFSKGLGEWVLISIKFGEIKNGYGFGTALRSAIYPTINKIKFTYVHSDKKDEGKNLQTGVIINPAVASGEVQIFLDQVIITQGGPYLIKPTSN